MIYGYSDKSLLVGLILSPFSRLVVVGSPLDPMACLAMGSCPSNGKGMCFILRNVLSPITEWLLISMMLNF